MASLRLQDIYKVYQSGVVAVTDFTLDIEDKEFIVFVGPSGCKKPIIVETVADAGAHRNDDRIAAEAEV